MNVETKGTFKEVPITLILGGWGLEEESDGGPERPLPILNPSHLVPLLRGNQYFKFLSYLSRYFMFVVVRIDPPKMSHIPIPKTCESDNLHCKRGFAEGITFRI